MAAGRPNGINLLREGVRPRGDEGSLNQGFGEEVEVFPDLAVNQMAVPVGLRASSMEALTRACIGVSSCIASVSFPTRFKICLEIFINLLEDDFLWVRGSRPIDDVLARTKLVIRALTDRHWSWFVASLRSLVAVQGDRRQEMCASGFRCEIGCGRGQVRSRPTHGS